MKNKEALKDELKNLSPFLAGLKGKPEGFDVPRDYFKSLQDEVFEKLNDGRQPMEAPKENWWAALVEYAQTLFQPKFVLAYASAAVLLVAGIFYLNQKNGTNTPPPLLASAILDQVPDDVLQDYIANNIDEFDESILEEELARNSSEPLPEFEMDSPDELLDELIDEMNIDELDDLL